MALSDLWLRKEKRLVQKQEQLFETIKIELEKAFTNSPFGSLKNGSSSFKAAPNHYHLTFTFEDSQRPAYLEIVIHSRNANKNPEIHIFASPDNPQKRSTHSNIEVIEATEKYIKEHDLKQYGEPKIVLQINDISELPNEVFSIALQLHKIANASTSQAAQKISQNNVKPVNTNGLNPFAARELSEKPLSDTEPVINKEREIAREAANDSIIDLLTWAQNSDNVDIHLEDPEVTNTGDGLEVEFVIEIKYSKDETEYLLIHFHPGDSKKSGHIELTSTSEEKHITQAVQEHFDLSEDENSYKIMGPLRFSELTRTIKKLIEKAETNQKRDAANGRAIFETRELSASLLEQPAPAN